MVLRVSNNTQLRGNQPALTSAYRFTSILDDGARLSIKLESDATRSSRHLRILVRLRIMEAECRFPTTTPIIVATDPRGPQSWPESSTNSGHGMGRRRAEGRHTMRPIFRLALCSPALAAACDSQVSTDAGDTDGARTPVDLTDLYSRTGRPLEY